MANSENTLPYQYRLDDFLEKYGSQLNEEEARLIFRIRTGDSLQDINNFLSSRNLKATVITKKGNADSIKNGYLSQEAFEAIKNRAKDVFFHNQNPPPVRRGRDVRSISLRRGDRLAKLPGSNIILENFLVDMAEEMGSIYSVHGSYGDAERYSKNLFEFLKCQFNSYQYNLPFSLVESLFKEEEFELGFVYDGLNNGETLDIKTFDLREGDPVVILAYNKVPENHSGLYESKEKDGFKIIHGSHSCH